jgi:hypothetical protein
MLYSKKSILKIVFALSVGLMDYLQKIFKVPWTIFSTPGENSLGLIDLSSVNKIS